jgi:hypothetical protein
MQVARKLTTAIGPLFAVVVTTMLITSIAAVAERPPEDRGTATYIVTGTVIDVRSVKSSWITNYTTTPEIVDIIKRPSLKINDKFMVKSFKTEFSQGQVDAPGPELPPKTGAAGYKPPPKAGDEITAYAGKTSCRSHGKSRAKLRTPRDAGRTQKALAV